jgi:hypothetical protein
VAPRPPVALRPLALVLCAWCRRYGRAYAQMRPAGSRRWEAVSHEYARALALSGLASHGLCPDCHPLALREWGVGPAERAPAAARWPPARVRR